MPIAFMLIAHTGLFYLHFVHFLPAVVNEDVNGELAVIVNVAHYRNLVAAHGYVYVLGFERLLLRPGRRAVEVYVERGGVVAGRGAEQHARREVYRAVPKGVGMELRLAAVPQSAAYVLVNGVDVLGREVNVLGHVLGHNDKFALGSLKLRGEARVVNVVVEGVNGGVDVVLGRVVLGHFGV